MGPKRGRPPFELPDDAGKNAMVIWLAVKSRERVIGKRKGARARHDVAEHYELSDDHVKRLCKQAGKAMRANPELRHACDWLLEGSGNEHSGGWTLQPHPRMKRGEPI